MTFKKNYEPWNKGKPWELESSEKRSKFGKANIKWKSKQDGDKHRYLKKMYGITLDEYIIMLKNQGGVCAICGKAETKVNRYGACSLSVDHNHTTKKVRELLCQKCNGALGLLNEDVALFAKCVAYLERHR